MIFAFRLRFETKKNPCPKQRSKFLSLKIGIVMKKPTKVLSGVDAFIASFNFFIFISLVFRLIQHCFLLVGTLVVGSKLIQIRAIPTLAW